MSCKVAVRKAKMSSAIIQYSLVSRCCYGSIGDVQIQGAVLDIEDLTFNFADSFSSWSYEDPKEIGEETLTNTTASADLPNAAGSLEVGSSAPFLPGGLVDGHWLWT